MLQLHVCLHMNNTTKINLNFVFNVIACVFHSMGFSNKIYVSILLLSFL